MVRYYQKKNNIIEELQEPVSGCWVNISAPFSHEELENTSETFNIPLDFLTDSLDIDERSRYEKEDDVRLIVINTPILNELDRENEAIYITVPIGVIITSDHVFTITSFENPVLELFLENRIKYFDTTQQGLFVLQILEQNVYRYLACLKKLNLQRHLIEKELYDSILNKDLRQLLRIQKSLVYFVNSLSANELLNMKMKRTDFLIIMNDEEKSEIFEDLIIDNKQALEMANVHTNILNGTMETYSSIISNNLNMVIQRLTLITIILMVPTLVASFYGMNVDLPFATFKYSFYIVLLFAIVISLGLVWFFRRKRLF
ncbi:MAG: magnesium transporter CorA family protein [Saprospiraceae bacterium]|nr:magnesium transporter CorA family protein [Saprospiraceae bacterium]